MFQTHATAAAAATAAFAIDERATTRFVCARLHTRQRRGVGVVAAAYDIIDYGGGCGGVGVGAAAAAALWRSLPRQLRTECARARGR